MTLRLLRHKGNDTVSYFMSIGMIRRYSYPVESFFFWGYLISRRTAESPLYSFGLDIRNLHHREKDPFPHTRPSPQSHPLNRARTRNGDSPSDIVSIGLVEPGPSPEKCDLHQIAHAIQVVSLAIAGTPVRHSGCYRMIGRAEWSFRRRRQLLRLLPPGLVPVVSV